jgi:hypothetical protein
VWSLVAPPADWFPFPGDELENTEPEPLKFSTLSSTKGAAGTEEVLLVPTSVAVTEEFEVDCTVEMASAAPAPQRSSNGGTNVSHNGEHRRERQNGSMKEMVREIVDEKLTEHSATMRRHFDDSLQQLLEKVYARMQANAEETRGEIRAVREALTIVPSPAPKGKASRRRKAVPSASN